MTMIFRDTVRITKSYKSPSWVDVPATFERAGGLRRGGYYDALAGDARCYVPANETTMDIGGYYLQCDKYGSTKTYRVINCAIGDRHVTGAGVTHVELDLEEVR